MTAPELRILLCTALLLAAPPLLRAQEAASGSETPQPAQSQPDAVAQDVPQTVPDAVPAGDTDTPPLLSVTVQADRFRDPFWPVGWEPDVYGLAGRSGGRGEGGIRRWQDAMRRVEITGLIRTADGSYLANVRGIGVVEVGDLIWVDYDGMIYKWRVREISERGIVPERVGVSPMRAPARQTE
jgi:hypothetical protein